MQRAAHQVRETALARGAATQDRAMRTTSSQERASSAVSGLAAGPASTDTARSRTRATKSPGEGNGPSARRCAGTAAEAGAGRSTGVGRRSLQQPVSRARTSALSWAAVTVHSAVAVSRSRASPCTARARSTPAR